MTVVLEQTKHLLYRNVLLKIRNKKETFQEIFLPIFFMVILAGIRASIPTKDEPVIERKAIPTFSLLRDFSLFSNQINSTPNVAVVSNKLKKAIEVVNVLRRYTGRLANFTESKSVEEMRARYLAREGIYSFGIVFEESNSSYLGLKYTLLSPYKKQPSTLEKTVDIGQCRDLNIFAGFNCLANNYLFYRILSFQAVIDAAIRAVGEDIPSLTEPNVTVQMMPKPRFKTSLQGFFITVAIYFVMSFAPIVSVLLINLVREKESKIKESMRIMGMKSLAFWLAWSIVYFVLILIVCLIMVVIAVPSNIFGNSSFVCVFLFLYLYGLSLVTMSFMITPFFKKAKVAGALGSVSTLVFGVMTLPVTLFDVSESVKWVVSLLSPAALTLGLAKGAVGDGLQFDTLFDSNESFPSGYSLIMLIVDIILYMILALYFDAVVPGEYGQRKAPYFCFLPSFWKGLFGWRSVRGEKFQTERASDFAGAADIEPISEELADKKAVRIHQLRKVFKGSDKEDIVAVNDVSLDIYEGQITALLGHNGAGKTTLLSVLTGLITSTSGIAEIYGHDVNSEEGQERIREMTGTCPQQNILFDNLTSFEHLRFFAGIKGIPQERVEPEIETLLNDVDLAKERDTFSKNLSGGQKRKLCLAISLIGDPKVVFLDEPTSGMDPYSRRSVWELLKRKSKDRVIFMTTHFMDEADILADYKAIMSNGKLRTAGSSLFLKNRFGIGYHLNMTVDESCVVNSMTRLVQSSVSGAKLAGGHGKELRYTLPLEGVDQFPDLFSVLEKNNSSGDDMCAAADLGVKSYAVSMTTLEEVFLQLGEEEESENSDSTDETVITNGHVQESACSVNCLPADDVANLSAMNQTYEKNTKKSFLQKQQFLALLKIRFLLTIRSPLKLIFHVFLPPVFLFFGLLISRGRTSQDLDKTKKLALEPSLYLSRASSESYAAPLLLRNSTALIGNLITEFQKRKIQSEVVKSFDDLLEKFPHNIAFDSINFTQNTSAYSLLYNDSTVHALPLAINIADSVILSMLRNASSVIESYVQAFPSMEQLFTFDAIAFNSALLVGLALVIIPGGFTISVVAYKEVKAQHLLRVSGVSAMIYWASFFAFDFLTMCMPLVLTLILVPAFGTKSFLVPGAMGALILALIIYSILGILLSYVLSFMFTSWQTANSVTPSLFSMAAMLGYLTVSLVDLIHYQDHPDLSMILHYIFLIIDPPYSIMGAVYFIDRVYRRESVIKQSVDVSPPASAYFTWTKQNGVPAALLIPACQIVLFTFLLFYLDARSRGQKINWPWSKCCSRTSDVEFLESKFEYDNDVTLDDDVMAERERIRDHSFDTLSGSHAVVCKGVWKVFGEKKTPKVVVRDLYCCVDSGEVFALLGPNGAGKTTLMNIVTCDLQPNDGKVFVAGNDVSSNAAEAYGHLGFCPQNDALWDNVTLEEHLHCYARIKGVPLNAIKNLVDCFMSVMKIKEHAKKRAVNLSGGTKRKLQFGMSLLGDPQLLLLDEPSSGLDPKSRRFLWDVIHQNIKGGRGAILTTHSMEEADAVSSRVGIMVKGQMKAIGSTQHLKNRFGSGFVLEIKLCPANHDEDSEGRFQELDRYIKENFTGAQISERFGFRASYKVPRSGIAALSKTFAALERGKEIVNIEEYSFSQTTLEQVFLELAKEQDDDRTGKSDDQPKPERRSSRRSRIGSHRLPESECDINTA